MPLILTRSTKTGGGGGFSLTHDQPATYAGENFGTKSPVAPTLWNRMTGNINTDYDLTVPNDAANSAHNMQYRAVGFRGVSGPHARCTHYMVGAHNTNSGPYAGVNVMANKLKSSRSNGDVYYLSWYARDDPNWEFGGSIDDDNHKIWAINCGGVGPYETPNDGYIDFDQGNLDNVNPLTHKLGIDMVQNPDANGHDNWWNSGANPFANWVLYEMEIKIQQNPGTSGYIKLWVNGTLVVNHAGYNTNGVGPSISFGIGGYSSTFGVTNNYRYFADAFIDWTGFRLLLTNNPVFASSTIRAPQAPSAWSSTSIMAPVNRGALNAGQVWPFVVKPDGTSVAVPGTWTMN